MHSRINKYRGRIGWVLKEAQFEHRTAESIDLAVAEMEQEAQQTVPVQVANSDGSGAVNRVRKLLFRRMLVGIKDGRFFLGAFHCMDKQGNIILQDAIEYRSTRQSSPSPMEQRCLGLILIPSSCRTSCHVDCSIDDQLSLLSLRQT
ncbi:hypothetical protein VNO77_25612 [Canavalia gladiata]|uniref:Sm domain-containing protein n=1 Tax=Canavalia gladiata TaxID=3824 RepID=A0AAN9LBU1_CANGL